MARFRGSTWNPVVPAPSKRTTNDGVVVHTAVQSGPAKAATASFLASGECQQHRETGYYTEANLNGNWRLDAFECMDRGPEFGNWDINDGHAVPGFTSAQRESLADKLAQHHEFHGTPLALLPNSKPGYRGIGYHRQGIVGNFIGNGYAYGGIVSGGEKWSNSTGKVCPGDRRISELITLIIPRARIIAGLDAPPRPDPPVEDELPSVDEVATATVLRLQPYFDQLNARLTAVESNVVSGIQEILDDSSLTLDQKLTAISKTVYAVGNKSRWDELNTIPWGSLDRWANL